MSTKPNKHIIVLGAGVTGLQCAIHLLRAGYSVTIVAKHLPADGDDLKGADVGEYASPWAGAHWRPHAGPADTEEQGWDIETYKDWLRIADAEDRDSIPQDQRSGLAIRTSILQWSTSHPEVQPTGLDSLWFKSRVDGFQALECRTPGTDIAASFKSITCNVPIYLKHLQRTIEQQGGTLIRSTLPINQGIEATLKSARQAAYRAGVPSADRVAAYINATGINARILCQDPNVIPIRGQTVLVEGEAENIYNRKGTDSATGKLYSAYAIPRVGSNTTVLGGCHVKGDWNLDAEPELTEKILHWARDMCPELMRDDGKGGKGFKVLRVMVGLRPGREGGARVERERCGGNGKGVLVVHAYGNGGAGYQNSVGVARKVVRLVGEGLRGSKL